MAARVRSFAPLANARSRVLVLGSMPGRASLAAGEYYAHPRNLFWPFAAAQFGFDCAIPYKQRCAKLRAAGVALWDVLQSCSRSGSLDAAIVEDTIVTNDFVQFFAQHPRIVCVFFNGAKAEQMFRRYVIPQLPAPVLGALQLRRLPSTSPANAGIPIIVKRRAWRALSRTTALQ